MHGYHADGYISGERKGRDRALVKTPISDEELKRLYEKHGTATIGKMVGRNAEGIRKRLKKLGVKMRPRGSVRTFTPSREELEAEYQTHSMRQIADKYGVGETVVWKRLKEFGIELHGYENGGHRLRPGRIFSEEHRRKLGLSMRGKVGPLNRNWKGGRTPENIRLRGSIEYREWKSAALALRGYKCQECGLPDRTTCGCCGTQVVLHVHHVKSFAKFPESRFDPENSEVLCPKCHRLRHRRR
jgi:biotin operon repressor